MAQTDLSKPEGPRPPGPSQQLQGSHHEVDANDQDENSSGSDESKPDRPKPVNRRVRSVLGVRQQPLPPKESFASEIAKQVVWTFTGALWGVLLLGFAMLAISLSLGQTVDATGTLFSKAVIPFIGSVATFSTTVFGPLLAFILGYYFGQKSKG